MTKVIILQGIPGSGKTTWAKDFCHENKNYIRVNRDDLRRMRGDYLLPDQEILITDFEMNCIFSSLERGYNVIVDSTNINPKFNKEMVNKIKKSYPYTEIEFKLFDVTLEEAIKRDENRIDSVGKDVIIKMYNNYLHLNETNKLVPVFDEVIIEKINQDSNLPHCIICDIDGTIALRGNRNPFDWNKVDEDLPNKSVIKLVSDLISYGYLVFFFSGRDEICRAKTYNWLMSHGIVSYNQSLFMRTHNDNRPDEIIKKELFDTYVKDKYYIEFILDDRNKVVKMWRDMGLDCLQVDEGAF
jgi:predicted kinase